MHMGNPAEVNIVFHILGMPVSDIVVATWIVMALILLVAFLSTRKLSLVPSGLQNVGEIIVEGFTKLVVDMMGTKGSPFVPLIMSIGLFVLIANLIGVVPGVATPTSNLATTVMLAGIVVIVGHGASIKKNGLLHYIKGYLDPHPIMLPMNIIGEIGKFLSHSFRLYGNMIGGAIIIQIIYMFAPWVVPVPVMGWFSVFMGAIQALVFTLLAIAYIDVML